MKKITHEQKQLLNSMLEIPNTTDMFYFSMDQVETAIFSLREGKTPSEDYIATEIIKHAWQIIVMCCQLYQFSG